MAVPNCLSIRLEEEAYRCTLTLSGELDLFTAPLLERAVSRLCAEGAKELVLDLRPLDFVDVAGLRGVMVARLSCQESAIRFGIVPGSGPAWRLLQLTQLFASLPPAPGRVES